LLFPKPPPTIPHNTGVGGFMSAARSETFQLGPLVATVLAFFAQPTTSWAYSQDEESACSGDAFTFSTLRGRYRWPAMYGSASAC
jgi:hypothetical protein